MCRCIFPCVLPLPFHASVLKPVPAVRTQAGVGKVCLLAFCPRVRTRAPLRVVTAFSRDGARRPNPGWLGGLSYRCVLSLSGGAVAALAAAVLAVAGAPVYAFPVIKATALAVGAVSVSKFAVEHFFWRFYQHYFSSSSNFDICVALQTTWLWLLFL